MRNGFMRLRLDIDDVKVLESKSLKISDLEQAWKDFKRKMK